MSIAQLGPHEGHARQGHRHNYVSVYCAVAWLTPCLPWVVSYSDMWFPSVLLTSILRILWYCCEVKATGADSCEVHTSSGNGLDRQQQVIILNCIDQDISYGIIWHHEATWSRVEYCGFRSCKGFAFHWGVSGTRWRHQTETFSALLACCEGNPPVTSGFPSQRPVTRSFDVFFNLRLETPVIWDAIALIITSLKWNEHQCGSSYLNTTPKYCRWKITSGSAGHGFYSINLYQCVLQ